MLVVNDDPVELAVHQLPPSSQRPVMSALPSPLKSPTLTSTQVAAVDQMAHKLVVNDEAVEMAVHQEPPCKYRPVMSALPSPLKSPTLTSTQVAARTPGRPPAVA